MAKRKMLRLTNTMKKQAAMTVQQWIASKFFVGIKLYSSQEVELSTLTLEYLNLSGCHTFQLDLCLLEALPQEQDLLRSFQTCIISSAKSVVMRSNMRLNLAT